jgi:lipoprotein signal peptidase
MRPKVTSLLIFVTGCFAVFLDQIFKLSASSQVANSGFALGINLGSSWLIQALVIAVLIFVVLRTPDKFLRSGLILIVIISLSNLFDRLRFGYVIDYWQIAGIWVNLSDVLISTIVAIMLLNYLFCSNGRAYSHSRAKRSA